MKTLLIAVAVIVLMIGAPSVFASTEYQSGYKHGVIDGKDSCLHPDGCHWYILQPDKGFAFHTKEFIRGYIAGWCLNSPPAGGSDADETRFQCNEPGWFPEGK